MRKIFITTIAASLFIFFLASCKKEQPVTEKTPQQKIVGKWMIESVMENDHYSGSDHITTENGTSADYMDFHSDGMVATSFQGNTDYVDYKVPSATMIIIDGDAFEIKTFTEKKFVMYLKENYGGGDYGEFTVSLVR